ncbi:MAG TPA: hypothetical protein VJU85_09315 [Nitrososphaeraceae archaeon]|nr:hypothetical protein [Nitrososphaeraceae archaeon]
MDRVATKDIFALLNFNFTEIYFHYIKRKKPIPTKDTPIKITINPLLVHDGLLYIQEGLGPTKDLF